MLGRTHLPERNTDPREEKCTLLTTCGPAHVYWSLLPKLVYTQSFVVVIWQQWERGRNRFFKSIVKWFANPREAILFIWCPGPGPVELTALESELSLLDEDGVKITPESQKKKKSDLFHVAKQSWFCKVCLYRRGKIIGLVIQQEGVCL